MKTLTPTPKRKNQFRPSYCVKCLQNRICEEFKFSDENLCCPCRITREKKRQKHNSYKSLLAEWQAERERHRDYLRQQSQNPKEWKFWCKWYQKQWGIDIAWWLQTFNNWMPWNLECVTKWKQDPQHVFCNCAEQLAHEWIANYSAKMSKYRQRLKKCQCVPHSKTRTAAEHVACESCGKDLTAASKKRFIKNRNDPKFWGLQTKERILCLTCMKNFQKLISVPRKRKLLSEYLKRGYA